MSIDRFKQALPGVAFIAALLLALEMANRLGLVNRSFVPAPSAVAAQIFALIVSGKVVAPLTTTVSLLFAGYAAGCLAAIGLGILMGNYPRVYNLLEPLVELLRPIPKAALLPVLILFLGLGTAMKITVIAIAAFFPVLINTVQGVRTLDPVLRDLARTFGHSGFSVLWRIVLPASAPYILSGMRIGLSISLIVAIIAEMVSGSGGLGDVIVYGQRMFLVTDSYAWLTIVAVLGFALDRLFRWTERRTTFWVAPSNA